MNRRTYRSLFNPRDNMDKRCAAKSGNQIASLSNRRKEGYLKQSPMKKYTPGLTTPAVLGQSRDAVSQDPLPLYCKTSNSQTKGVVKVIEGGRRKLDDCNGGHSLQLLDRGK
ncbi:hypothetical protein NPIL_229021 [Nephila pilipes]|uniref:Uncharacterized protein n=1 Tax=Nephila pilipes TaxID=299642 RepID=A0A8X6P391_NEPPI|nr:hypothetical protein NPIL_229021 [Nephila pilipes]